MYKTVKKKRKTKRTKKNERKRIGPAKMGQLDRTGPFWRKTGPLHQTAFPFLFFPFSH
jgi:hypothetical protein